MARQSLLVILCIAACALAVSRQHAARSECYEQSVSEFCRAAEFGQVADMRHMLDAHPELAGARDCLGCTPLHTAAWGGHDAAVDFLLRSGADPLLADSTGTTALHAAVAGGSRHMVHQLIDAGADVNAADLLGSTPLHVAARFGDRGKVRLLLAHAADADAQDIQGKTPADLLRAGARKL